MNKKWKEEAEEFYSSAVNDKDCTLAREQIEYLKQIGLKQFMEIAIDLENVLPTKQKELPVIVLLMLGKDLWRE